MARMRSRPCSAAVLLLTVLALPAAAQEILVDENAPPTPDGVSRFFAPYPVAGETYDFGLGAFYATTGRFQPQLGLYASVLASSNGSGNLFLGANDYRLPYTERAYLDAFVLLGHYSNLRAYVDGNPEYPNESAGSNDSNREDFIRDRANEVWVEFPLNYLLPIGAGEEALHTYTLDRGILADGSTNTGGWNPLRSGRTSLTFKPFVRRQEFNDAPQRGMISTNGFALGAKYDNTDFNRNPSLGSRQELTFTRDPGWFASSDSWSTLEFKYSKFLPFQPTVNQRQRVLAFGFWTADTPTWSEAPDGSVSNRPPYFKGATLGGLRRLRAYPDNRFNDKSAILYDLEYRVIPAWHPLKRVNALERFDLDWWQWVVFGEVGRVAESWNLSTLHTDMKYDVGLSLRLMARKQIVRIDLAIGPEGWTLVFDVGQPF